VRGCEALDGASHRKGAGLMRLYQVLVVLAAAGVLLGAFGLQPVESKSDEFVCTTDDAAQGARQLKAFLDEHDVKVLKLGSEAVYVDRVFKMALEPKLSDDGLDRIVVHVFFTPKAEYKTGGTIVQLANDLDRQYNVGGFFVDGDGDLVLQSQMTFVDRISWEEIDGFLEWLSLSLLIMAMSDQTGFSKYIK